MFKYYNKQYFLYFLFPIFVLLEGLFVEPLWEVKAVENTLPYFQFIFLLVFLLVFLGLKRNRTNKTSLLFLLIGGILIYGVILNKSDISDKLALSIVVLLPLMFFLTESKNHYTKVQYFIISYISLSIIIYILRLYAHNFDLFKVRGSMNIWGGNPVIMIVYLFSASQLLLKKPLIHVFLYNIVALIFSLIFMDRVAVVTSLILVTLIGAVNLKGNPRKTFLLIIILIFIGSYYLVDSELLNNIESRFAQHSNADKSNLGYFGIISGDRLMLFNLSLDIIQNNMEGIGIGGLREYTKYSSAHNLLLNNILEFGVLFGLILNLILIYPIGKIIYRKDKRLNKLMILSIYLAFLLNAVIAGNKMIQSSGYTSSFFLFFLFFLLFALKQKTVIYE